MAKITRENVNQIITDTALVKKLKALIALQDAKEKLDIIDIVNSWYEMYDLLKKN